MRDYVQYFYTVDPNTNTPVTATLAYTHYFFKTMAECQAFIDSLGGNSPSNSGPMSPAAPVWLRLNKDIFLGYLNNAFVQNLGPNVTSTGVQLAYTDGSPRSLGVNSTEEKSGHGVKFDFSGAGTLVENFLSIMQSLIKVYSSRGDKRTVGILKDLLNKFLNGQESITDILDELRKLFII